MSLSKVVEVCKVLGLAIRWLVGDAHGAWLLGQECVESEVSMQARDTSQQKKKKKAICGGVTVLPNGKENR
jgi:hypothetical protein